MIWWRCCFCRWIAAFNDKKKIGIYLNDISVSFDKVHTERLMKKIEQAGVNEEFITFIKAYLAERSAVVVVNGKSSSKMRLSNMIFQGTVLGPLLWNVFFKDLDDAIEDDSVSINKFADLNIQKTYQ